MINTLNSKEHIDHPGSSHEATIMDMDTMLV